MYQQLRPLLFSLSAESAHNLVFRATRAVNPFLPSALLGGHQFTHPSIQQKLWGLEFDNPVGLAAGMDKNALLTHFWPKIGFGFVEIGSVSALLSKGNPKPRSFRLEADEAIINRMGLNNHGAKKISARLKRQLRKSTVPVGINLAKTHDPRIMGTSAVEDFRVCYSKLAPHCSYVTLNISCPNTEEGKTFEDPQALYDLLSAIRRQRKEQNLLDTPVLVKFSPPEDNQFVYDSRFEELVSVATLFRVDGIVATNTASDRKGLTASDDQISEIGQGGMSGKPLRRRSTALIAYLYGQTGGQIPIIGVGGVSSAESAYEKILAGASLVQLYTALVYQGPKIASTINRGLVDLLNRDGFSHLSEAIGKHAVDLSSSPL